MTALSTSLIPRRHRGFPGNLVHNGGIRSHILTALLKALQAKKTHVQVGSIRLGVQAYNNFRGKFNRMCSKKPKSGRLDVPESIHKIFQEKGNAKDQLFENFVKANGDKDFICSGHQLGPSKMVWGLGHVSII